MHTVNLISTSFAILALTGAGALAEPVAAVTPTLNPHDFGAGALAEPVAAVAPTFNPHDFGATALAAAAPDQSRDALSPAPCQRGVGWALHCDIDSQAIPGAGDEIDTSFEATVIALAGQGYTNLSMMNADPYRLRGHDRNGQGVELSISIIDGAILSQRFAPLDR